MLGALHAPPRSSDRLLKIACRPFGSVPTIPGADRRAELARAVAAQRRPGNPRAMVMIFSVRPKRRLGTSGASRPRRRTIVRRRRAHYRKRDRRTWGSRNAVAAWATGAESRRERRPFPARCATRGNRVRRLRRPRRSWRARSSKAVQASRRLRCGRSADVRRVRSPAPV